MKKFIADQNYRTQRILEILPGLTAWTIILFPIWGALVIPQIVAYLTIAFLVYWFYRSFISAILGVKGFLKIRQSQKVNWQKKYEQDKDAKSLDWRKIRHLIIIPNATESVEKITLPLDSLTRQENIDRRQLLIILAMEGRVKDARQKAKILLERYQGKFGQLIATFHPADIPGEIIGKASNEAWAAKYFRRKYIKNDSQARDYTITSCDADASFHPKYFSALTYSFCTNQKRYLRFWQSPIFWHNNLWRVPAFVRIIGIMGTAIHIASLQEPDRLFFNYSTYSASLKMLDDVGYWHPDIIPEDWHIFLQCFFHKHGKVEVEPIFLPTSIDAPEGKTYFKSLKNRYEQCKRHAWGATDIPYAVKQAIKHPEIPLWTRVFRIYKILETHIIWSTNWFILTLGAWLPALINPVFKQTSLGYNLPKISQIILTTCLLFLLTMVILDLNLRPKRPHNLPWWYPVKEVLQWVFMPVASLFMSVLPGLDSQTRLMLGKRIEYKVTEKI